MMKAKTILPMDIELHFDGNNQNRKEQYEVLEIVCRALDQSISKWLTETMLSMLECELDSTVPGVLQKKLDRPVRMVIAK